MAPAFPLARHRALDVAVRAHLDMALAAEAALLRRQPPAARADLLAVLRRNGALLTERRLAREAAGLGGDAAEVDGSTWDAPDVDGGFS